MKMSVKKIMLLVPAIMMSVSFVAFGSLKKKSTGSTLKTIGSGIKKTGSGLLSGAKKISKIAQPYAEGAFALGQTALAHKHAQAAARDDHQRQLEANRMSHQQNLEAMRAQQEHEFKLKQMDIELEKMKLQNNPARTSQLLRQRNQEIRNFDNFMSNYENGNNQDMSDYDGDDNQEM